MKHTLVPRERRLLPRTLPSGDLEDLSEVREDEVTRHSRKERSSDDHVPIPSPVLSDDSDSRNTAASSFQFQCGRP